MSNIGPTYPAHIVVSQAEVRLVADETTNATAATIKSDQHACRCGLEANRQGTRGFVPEATNKRPDIGLDRSRRGFCALSGMRRAKRKPASWWRPARCHSAVVKVTAHFASTYFPSFTVRRMRERSSRP